jgi:2-alkenal reductase
MVSPPPTPAPEPTHAVYARPEGRHISVWWAALIAVAAAIGGGGVSGLVVDHFESSPRTAAAIPTTVGTKLTVEQTSAVADAAAEARPAVVRIESTQRTNGGTEQDVGSGVVMDTEGHIITNAHVVMNTDSLKVILADGSSRQAILVGHDYPFTDLAVLQIAPGSLTPLPMGDSSALKLGETVIAIGNPLAEFDGSVSVGVVSGLNRVRTFDAVRQSDLIQTDAAVNNGNSGGALVNLAGQFVGMPTAIIRQARSGQAVEGIAFALPANRVLQIANAIIQAGGQVPRPSLQMDHIDLSPDSAPPRGVRLSVREGAVVATLVPGGAADSAGIQVGDVITKVGDTDVDADTPLLNALVSYHPGDTVKVVLNRNGRIIEAEVRLAKRS